MRSKIVTLYRESLLESDGLIHNKIEIENREDGCLRRVLELPYGLVCQRLRDMAWRQHPFLYAVNCLPSPELQRQVYAEEKYMIITESDKLDILWKQVLRDELGQGPLDCHLRFLRITR